MSQPVLHLLAGSNGAGKSTLAQLRIIPETGLPFVNADVIAAERWPGEELEHAYDASRAAAEARALALQQRWSFITETVFSHPSKLDLISEAKAAGYIVTLHVVIVPEELTVARVRQRVGDGGHDVPEQKVRERYHRLWALVAEACALVDRAVVYDNARSDAALREIALLAAGKLVGEADWPAWAPAELKALA